VTAPLVVELYCGTFGWSHGWLALGGRAIGFDVEHQPYHGPIPTGAELVLQDVRTLHGSQFKDALLILGSSPCQEFSYRAMPWKRAKALGPPLLGIELFDAQFRIQREACEAAGRYIPMVVENVRGAQKYVGRSRWNFGSYHLWGDVPALMPTTVPRAKVGGDWNKFNKDGTVSQFNAVSEARVRDDVKNSGGSWFAVSHSTTPHNHARDELVKVGGDWFNDRTPGAICSMGSKSSARRAASAAIARIPEVLSHHIAQTYYPEALALGVA
jgi:hypothetical protein